MAVKEEEQSGEGTPPPREPAVLTGIVKPGPHDVLCGRGGGTNNHTGNIKFRQMVNQHKLRYLAASKVEKPKVAREVVQLWRQLDPPGRFLARESDKESKEKGDNPAEGGKEKGVWNDVGDKKAREKASQCLRERTPDVIPFVRELQRQQDIFTGQGLRYVEQQMAARQQQQQNQQHTMPHTQGSGIHAVTPDINGNTEYFEEPILTPVPGPGPQQVMGRNINDHDLVNAFSLEHHATNGFQGHPEHAFQASFDHHQPQHQPHQQQQQQQLQQQLQQTQTLATQPQSLQQGGWDFPPQVLASGQNISLTQGHPINDQQPAFDHVGHQNYLHQLELAKSMGHGGPPPAPAPAPRRAVPDQQTSSMHAYNANNPAATSSSNSQFTAMIANFNAGLIDGFGDDTGAAGEMTLEEYHHSLKEYIKRNGLTDDDDDDAPCEAPEDRTKQLEETQQNSWIKSFHSIESGAMMSVQDIDDECFNATYTPEQQQFHAFQQQAFQHQHQHQNQQQKRQQQPPQPPAKSKSQGTNKKNSLEAHMKRVDGQISRSQKLSQSKGSVHGMSTVSGMSGMSMLSEMSDVSFGVTPSVNEEIKDALAGDSGSVFTSRSTKMDRARGMRDSNISMMSDITDLSGKISSMGL